MTATIEPTSTTVVDHPLTPLSADEIREVRRIVDEHGLLGDSVRFVYAALEEPHKDVVLAFRPGDAIEWTVVNAAGLPGRVTLGWKKDNPLKGTTGEPFDRRVRDSVRTKVKDGVYKYSVLLDGKVVFDPDIEIMS